MCHGISASKAREGTYCEFHGRWWCHGSERDARPAKLVICSGEPSIRGVDNFMIYMMITNYIYITFNLTIFSIYVAITIHNVCSVQQSCLNDQAKLSFTAWLTPNDQV